MKRLRLLVPVSVIAAVVLLLIAPVTVLAAPNAGGDPGADCDQWYKVRRGDTLEEIAWRYGTSTWELAKINHLRNPNVIYTGQVLCIDSGNGQDNGGFTYTVKRGDTLGNIGWRFGSSARELARANRLHNPNVIYPGQQLWIPKDNW